MADNIETWGESYLYTLSPPDHACFTCTLPTCINNDTMPYRMPPTCNWRKAYDAFTSDEPETRSQGWLTINEAEKATHTSRFTIYKLIKREYIRHKWVWRTPQCRVLYVHPDDFKQEEVVARNQDVPYLKYLLEEGVK